MCIMVYATTYYKRHQILLAYDNDTVNDGGDLWIPREQHTRLWSIPGAETRSLGDGESQSCKSLGKAQSCANETRGRYQVT